MWKQKNYLVFEHAFVMVPTFFERNLHYVFRGIMLEWACHMFTRAWREREMLYGQAAILNLLSKYPELDETLLKWFSEKKSQDKSKFCSLKHNALLSWFCQIVLQCLHKLWEWLLLIGQLLMLSKQDKKSSKGRSAPADKIAIVHGKIQGQILSWQFLSRLLHLHWHNKSF